MGSTYKGLAQTGAWGCFDEFNRIPVAPVCSTQYKTVLDAIRAKKSQFMFEDVEISLRPSTMAFITMNPGYPGRRAARVARRSSARSPCAAPTSA